VIPLLWALVFAAAAEVVELPVALEPLSASLPPAVGVERVVLPEVREHTLPGGAPLWEVPQPGGSLVAVELLLTLPSALVTPELGQALKLLPAVIDAGAPDAPRGGLDAQLEPLGASVLLAPLSTGLRLRLLAPPDRLDQALDVVARALADPACESRIFQSINASTRGAQERARYTASGAMARVELEALYPSTHPLAPPRFVPRVDAEGLLAAHRLLLDHGGAVVVLVGPVDAQARGSLERALPFLAAPPAESTFPSARQDPVRAPVWLLEDDGARQVRLTVTWPVPGDLSWAEAQLVADVLGGGATARLDRRLREELGLVYEARARLVRRPGHALLRVSTRVDGPRSVEAVEALQAILADIGLLDAAELQRARATRLFAVARQLDGVEGGADVLADLAALGLSPAGQQGELDALAALDLPAVQSAAATLLDPAAATWVILGDPDDLAELQRLPGLQPACETSREHGLACP